jgi:pimeloyl-ACP methyl ester carboxylesterase
MLKKIVMGVFVVIGCTCLAVAVWPEKAYVPYRVSPAYQARVDAVTMPSLPDAWIWESYEAKDGTQLRWGHTQGNDEAHATIVLIPGYTSTLEHFAEHISHWADQGYNVVGIDLRGQGGSERPLENPEKYWIDSFATYA